ncbi:putative glycosyl family 2 protein [Botrytis fragariae]|uniref:Putative glycosyl family 2 protein n=1 Tax=Botrytis fragariae TaxID=1964551 RepID=A0A8H6ATM4_9HELO|nr:putative glycosyl family 2 protein [Botrytis fragariae]KAF5873235.1 putative glycosyl family 2 protein [Botrytis fragariae]
MLFNFLSGAHGVPWKFIFLCISALVMVHYVLVDIPPSDESLPETSKSVEATDILPSPTPPKHAGSAGTFDEFKAMLGIFGGTETSNSEDASLSEDTMSLGTVGPGHKLKKPFLGSKQDTRDDEYVSVCMAVKDQQQDLPEFFIHHYYHLGIKRFYIMDDGSDPPLSEMEDLGIPREHVTFQYFNKSEHTYYMQEHVYKLCVEKYRSNHTWMAFIDADEYLEMTGKENLNEFLESYEEDEHVGAVYVSWMTHSSAGLLSRPKSVRQAYIDCVWDGEGHNVLGKTIAKLSLYAGPNTVHQVRCKDGAIVVDENGIKAPVRRYSPTRDRIALHHYALKSREEYQEKVDRGNAMSTPKNWGFWDSVEGMAGIECLSMTEYYP